MEWKRTEGRVVKCRFPALPGSKKKKNKAKTVEALGYHWGNFSPQTHIFVFRINRRHGDIKSIESKYSEQMRRQDNSFPIWPCTWTLFFHCDQTKKKKRIRNKENERQETQPVSFFFFSPTFSACPRSSHRPTPETANVFFFLVSFITRIIFSPRS